MTLVQQYINLQNYCHAPEIVIRIIGGVVVGRQQLT